MFNDIYIYIYIYIFGIEKKVHNIYIYIYDRPSTTVTRMKQADKARLDAEYRRLVEGLRSSGAVAGIDGSQAADACILGNPVLPDDILNEAIPGIFSFS